MNHGDTTKGQMATVCMRLALYEHTPAEKHQFDRERMPAPHFRSGISRLDRWHGCPGPYGVTAFAAPAKVGKTMAAIAAALETAATMDWRVVYFNAELDEHTFNERVQRYIDSHPAAEDARSMMQVYHVGRGVTPEELVACAEEEQSAEPVLVVIDSINTLANLAGGSYFDQINRFSLWAMMARRHSGGACSFLIVSETNTRGGVKGEQIQYWADLVLRFKGQEHAPYIEVEMTHSRATPTQFLGRYVRHVDSGAFVHEHDWEGLRMVRGGER